MEQYMGKPIVIAVPLGVDHKIDARVMSVIEMWDRGRVAESYYAPSKSAALGRDMAVSFAQYKIPLVTHILFIDSDVMPRMNTLDKLLNLDKDIVTGVYPMTTRKGLAWSVAKEDTFCEIDGLPSNPFKVRYSGCGCMLVKMKVFEKLEWPYWKDEFKPGCIEKGEDIYFCDKAREAGFDIWCEPKVKCSHVRLTNLLSIVNNMKG